MVYSTAVLKNASEILETNALSKKVDQIKEDIQPTIAIEPYINIFRSSQTGSGTLYTTPADSDFYLTNMHMNGSFVGGLGGDMDLSMQMTLSDGTVVVTKLTGTSQTEGIANSMTINFPMRGILLARNSQIVVSAGGDVQNFTIAGYIGSNRSGL